MFAFAARIRNDDNQIGRAAIGDEGFGAINDPAIAVFFGVCFNVLKVRPCLLYTSPSPRDGLLSRMPSSA